MLIEVEHDSIGERRIALQQPRGDRPDPVLAPREIVEHGEEILYRRLAVAHDPHSIAQRFGLAYVGSGAMRETVPQLSDGRRQVVANREASLGADGAMRMVRWRRTIKKPHQLHRLQLADDRSNGCRRG